MRIQCHTICGKIVRKRLHQCCHTSQLQLCQLILRTALHTGLRQLRHTLSKNPIALSQNQHCSHFLQNAWRRTSFHLRQAILRKAMDWKQNPLQFLTYRKVFMTILLLPKSIILRNKAKDHWSRLTPQAQREEKTLNSHYLIPKGKRQRKIDSLKLHRDTIYIKVRAKWVPVLKQHYSRQAFLAHRTVVPSLKLKQFFWRKGTRERSGLRL